LRNVTARAEGTYKCEVSTEGPIFDTDYKLANLTVIDDGRWSIDLPSVEWDSAPVPSASSPLPDSEYARRSQPVVASFPGHKRARNSASIFSPLHWMVWSVLLFH